MIRCETARKEILNTYATINKCMIDNRSKLTSDIHIWYKEQVSGCVHMDTSIYDSPSSTHPSYSKHEFALIPMAAVHIDALSVLRVPYEYELAA